MTVSAAYIAKRGRDYIGWKDTGSTSTERSVTLSDGTVLRVSDLSNKTADRFFYLTNPGDLFLDYDGLVLAMEKRLSKRWQASGSYTFSRAYRMQVTSNAAVSEGQFSTIARPDSLTFGRTQRPDECHGTLANDRPHVFRTIDWPSSLGPGRRRQPAVPSPASHGQPLHKWWCLRTRLVSGS